MIKYYITTDENSLIKQDQETFRYWYFIPKDASNTLRENEWSRSFDTYNQMRALKLQDIIKHYNDNLVYLAFSKEYLENLVIE